MLRRYFWSEKQYLLLLAPLLIFVFVIAIYPLSFSFFISFFKFRLTDPDQIKTFLGLENYVDAFQDPRVIKSVSNTLVFVFGTVSLELIVGLGLAMLLASETRLMQFIRSSFLMPMASTLR